MKKWAKISLIPVIIFVIIIFLLFINGYTADCNKNHIYDNQTNYCYYSALTKSDCAINEEFDGNVCYYYPQGFLSNSLLIWIVALLLFVGITLSIYYFWNLGKNKQKQFEYKNKPELDPDNAIEAVKKHWAKRYNIYYWEDKIGFHIKKDSFKINDQEPFQKPNFEWFLQFEIEVNEGDKQGIFTIIVSLNQKIKNILKGKYRIKHCLFDDYKESPTKRPLYQRQDKSERMADLLIQQGRTEEAKRILVSQYDNFQNQTEIPIEEMEEQRELSRQSIDKRRIENRRINKYNTIRRRY